MYSGIFPCQKKKSNSFFYKYCGMFHWLGIASPNRFSVDECIVVLEQLYQVLYTYYTIHPLKVYNSMVLEYYVINFQKLHKT